MSFRTPPAFFKTTKTQVYKLKIKISTVYHAALQKPGDKIHGLLSLIALSVWENYRRAYNLFGQSTRFLLPQTPWFAKEFPVSHPSANSKGRMVLATFSSTFFFMKLCQKWDCRKYHWSLAGLLSPCKEDGAKSSSCRTSKTWRTFCFFSSLLLTKGFSLKTNHKVLFPLPPLLKHFLICSC